MPTYHIISKVKTYTTLYWCLQVMSDFLLNDIFWTNIVAICFVIEDSFFISPSFPSFFNAESTVTMATRKWQFVETSQTEGLKGVVSAHDEDVTFCSDDILIQEFNNRMFFFNPFKARVVSRRQVWIFIKSLRIMFKCLNLNA